MQLQAGGEVEAILLGGCKGHRDPCRFRKTELVSKPFNVNFLGTIYTDSGVDDLEWETVISNREAFCRCKTNVPTITTNFTPTPFPSLSHHPLQSTAEFAKILFISLKYRWAQVLLFLLLFSFFIPMACDTDSWGTCSGWPLHRDAELWLGSSLLILNFKGCWSSEQTFSSPWPFLSQPHWSPSREGTGSLSWQDSEGPNALQAT